MLKCAFYEKEITPPLGHNLPGYFNFRPAADVKDRLYAKAIVVANGNEKVAIIAIDACASLWKYRKKTIERIEKFTDIKGDNVIFSVNHTHTGIPDMRSNIVEGDDKYIDVVYDLVADCVILADKRLKDCVVRYGKGTVEGVSFVRDYYMKNGTPQTNPGRLNPDIERPVADIDSDLPVVLFNGMDNKPIGAIINFACHQDCVGGEELSGDFSSCISYELKKAYGNDFVSIFMAGTSGDINHFDVSKAKDEPDHYITMGKIIAGEALKAIADSTPIIGEELAAKLEFVKVKRLEIPENEIINAKHIMETVVPVENVKIAADDTDPDQYAYAMAKTLIDFLNKPEVYDVPVQAVRIGDLIIFAYPGEPFCYFGKEIKIRIKSSKSIVASLCNDYIGYIPTRDMFYDTIYESLPGSCELEKEGGYILTDKLIEMSDSLF